MADTLVGGAFLCAFLQVLFDRLASEEVLELLKRKKPIIDLLEQLKTQLIYADALLDDAEAKQIGKDHTKVRKWLNELKDAILEADDLVDEIDYEAFRSKLEDESTSSSSKAFGKFKALFSTTFDDKVKPEIEKILGRLKTLVGQKDVLGLEKGVQNKSSQRPPAPLVEESDVYGRINEKIEIVSELLSDAHKISVIPIIGMGGIGKTTLAQLLYKDGRVDGHFEIKAWVTVSDDFDVFRIAKAVLESVTNSKCHIEDQFRVQTELKEALKGKKFLLILDDVWSEDYDLWDSLKSSFQSVAEGSSVVVTTRSDKVAKMMAQGPTYHLKGMETEDCWKLFVKHAFGGNGDPNAYPNLQEIGRAIVKRCKGLPLAVKSLAGLLRSEHNPKKWEAVLNSDLWELHERECKILPALWLSYLHLPAHLKQCFAYFSIFPKDYEFESKEKIIWLWMAEGFLPPDKNGKTMEDCGEEYFEDLISRSFLEQSRRRGRFTVRIHDLVHDLAMMVSGEFCFRLDHRSDLPRSLSSKARHLSYDKTIKYNMGKLESLSKAKSLRTFLALPLSKIFYRGVINDSLVPTGRRLRVLSLSGSSITKLNDSIGSLKHLRYLDLSNTRIEELPDSICSLYHLQTLLLCDCEKLTRLPNNMRSLINLRHLDITGVWLREIPMQVCNLKVSLNVIVGDELGGRKIFKGLGELQDQCRKLNISRLENVAEARTALEANLMNKEGLDELSLKWEGGGADDSRKEKEILSALQPHTNLKELTIVFYRGAAFPDWVGHHSFANVVSITLQNCKNCCWLPPLGQLPSLKHLSIRGFDLVVEIGDEFHGRTGSPFRSLERLDIWNMCEWEKWSFSDAILEGGIFPCLTYLCLYECPKLKACLPASFIPSLKQLRVQSCQEMEVLHPKTKQTDVAFPSLISLEVEYCKELESAPQLEQLTNLKGLSLRGSKLFKNRMHWDLGRLASLEELILWEWEDDSFPEEGLLLPTSLRTIDIWDCRNLEGLNGKVFQHLTSLEKFSVLNCNKLRCLPEEGLPSSLSKLYISGCPLLEPRCQNGGEECSKIAHIPFVQIDCRRI
ncbi:hypothetical protein UlMin_009076 [Ulmus minor]